MKWQDRHVPQTDEGAVVDVLAEFPLLQPPAIGTGRHRLTGNRLELVTDGVNPARAPSQHAGSQCSPIGWRGRPPGSGSWEGAGVKKCHRGKAVSPSGLRFQQRGPDHSTRVPPHAVPQSLLIVRHHPLLSHLRTRSRSRAHFLRDTARGASSAAKALRTITHRQAHPWEISERSTIRRGASS